MLYCAEFRPQSKAKCVTYDRGLPQSYDDCFHPLCPALLLGFRQRREQAGTACLPVREASRLTFRGSKFGLSSPTSSPSGQQIVPKIP